jgi:2-polyprenyl-3-methyl-5-hydroxy-6-metoxy-1,4-benzoquinol methylase
LQPEYIEDPVVAYGRLAAQYGELSRRREHYLRSVERQILARVPSGARSLLDAGAGDGSRTSRIAETAGIKRVVLIEPCRELVAGASQRFEVWPVRAEELFTGVDAGDRPGSEQFDVVTCLWNVLGHIPGEKRPRALTAIAKLLSPSGKFFLDVNHRYNLRSYGIIQTAFRYVHDQLFWKPRTGDVTARWTTPSEPVSTYGHVFIHREVMRLAHSAGLELESRLVIDYGDGRVRRFSCLGNLLYIFRRNSRIDSSSAPQTS